MAEENLDLVVIGGGPAGYVAALRSAQLGLKTACVEKSKTLGGTCLNVGCIPSKALLDSSEYFSLARHKFSRHGIVVSETRVDVGTMMTRKDQVVRGLTAGIASLFKRAKIEHLLGHGALVSSNDEGVEVAVMGELPRRLRAKNVILATGSEAARLPAAPFDGKRIISSTEALALPAVPARLLVIGAGAIGLELGSVWSRLGSKVTVVEFMDRIVPAADRQASQELQRALTRQGFEFRLSTKVAGTKIDGDIVHVALEDSEGKTDRLEVDVVLVAVGRRPYSADLGLERLGIGVDRGGRVEVDEGYKTKAKHVYAIGDLIRGPMLAHKAHEEGIAVVELIAGQHGHVNYGAIPNVVYTWPELASVGLSEEECRAKGVEFKTGTFPFIANGRAKAMDEVEGFAKVLADAKTDKVVGVHVVGPRASDMIAEGVAVMEFGGSAEDIARTCHAHPTLSEVLMEAALAVDKRALHI